MAQRKMSGQNIGLGHMICMHCNVPRSSRQAMGGSLFTNTLGFFSPMQTYLGLSLPLLAV